MYYRPMYHVLAKRLREPRRFIQVLAGPRQTGGVRIDFEAKRIHRGEYDDIIKDPTPYIEEKLHIES